MKKLMAFILLGSALLMVACAQKPASQDIGHTVQPQEVEVADADTNFIKVFSYNLFGQVQNGQENVVVSPASVLYALSMTANGAQGETQRQMLDVLMPEFYFMYQDGQPLEYNLPCRVNPDYARDTKSLNEALYLYNQKLTGDVVRLANAIWLKDSGLQVKDAFLQSVADYYGREIYTAPFDNSTVKEINSFVEKNTKGMIKNITDRLDPRTRVVLVNAIAFEGEWRHEFDALNTRTGLFNNCDGTTETVQFMHGEEYTYLENDVCTGFVKRYKDGFNFVALLPKEDAAEEFSRSFNGCQLDAMLENRQSIKTYITVPKFDYRYSCDMCDVLSRMGMPLAFDAQGADFTAMGVADGNLYIGAVTHRAKVTMDEKGTKAGAATMVETKAAGMARSEDYREVILDRPFVWAICDADTNTPVFMGRINNMSAGCGLE